jgi:hypothetical protein
MQRAACHCGRDNSIVNNTLGEPGHTPLYVRLLPAWGSMDGDLMFFPILEEDSFFWGLRQTYMDRPVALVTECLSP